MCCWVFKNSTVVHHSAFSHVIHFTRWDWMWLNCDVKYTFSCNIIWCPSFSHSKADMLHQNRYNLLWLVINQPVRYCMLNSSLAVCYEMRSRCDVSSGPNQMGAMGCERWNSNFFLEWGGSFYVAECVASVFSAGPLRRTQAAVPLRSNVHMFALGLKYRCIHYVSEHSRFNTFKPVCPNIGDLPQVQRQMSNTRTCLLAGTDSLFSLSWLHGSCQICKCF